MCSVSRSRFKRPSTGARIDDLAQISLDQLATRIRESDSRALSEAYTRLNEPLVRYIQQFVRDVPTAYDVLQDIFLKLWEERARMRKGTHLKALLYTMARNRALNVIRKDARKERLETAHLDQLSTLVSVEMQMDADSLGRTIEGWVRQLPPRRAEAFMLSRFHELRHSDVASIMGLSERTVQTHVLHALRDLRKQLKTYRQNSESQG